MAVLVVIHQSLAAAGRMNRFWACLGKVTGAFGANIRLLLWDGLE